MPKPTPVTTRPSHRGGAQTAAALLRALLSLTVLALLLAGLPVLLWWATSLVGPPGLAALSHLLSTEDSGQVFLLVLAVAGWAGWACFTGAVLLEIPAQLHGRTAPQIRGLVGQRAAATLVGAVLLALPAGTALAAPSAAAPATSPAGVSASPVPGSGTQSAPRADAPADAPSTAVTYTVRDVRPAESLWSIAQQTLGSGERWTDIAALNQGRTMADGAVFDAERPIQPGWVLTLPTGASVPAAQPAAASTEGSAPQSGQASYTVREGDSLASIAASQLGSPDRFQELFDLNQGQPLPGGGTFTDPNLIYPGQQLTLPPANPPAEPAAPTASPQSPKPGPATPPAATSPATAAPQTAPSAQAPAPSAPATTPAAQLPAQKSAGPATAPSSPATHTPAAPTPAPDAPRVQSTAAGVNWALVAGVGTLLAASLAGALGVRRVLQQRRRRAGQTIAQDHDPNTLEQLLTAAGEPAGVEILDRILRTLAHQAATDERALPALRGVLLAGKEVRLLLDESADPVAPFTAGPDSRTWTLDPAAVLPDAEMLNDVEAPYPGLVTLGAHEDGLLLADLTTCHVLLLDGTPEEVLEVGRALALELGTSGWTDYSEILTAGLGSRLAKLLPQGRIRTVPHLPAVAADLGELLLEAHQSGEQVLPWLMIGVGDHEGEHLAQLADALAAARDLKTAVVLPASEAAQRVFPHAEIIDVTTGQEALLAPLGLPVTLQRITDEQYRQYVHALEVSTQDPVPATGAWEFAESHDQAAACGQPLTLRSTTAEAQDPGNPFPALIDASPATAPQPVGHQGNAEAGQSAADGAETAGTAEPDENGQAATDKAPVPAQTAAAVPAKAAGEERAPVRIDMLGPLRITGTAASAHGPRTAAVAALLHLRPGRGTDYLCQAMDPVNPWSTRTLHSRLSELRNVLGLTSDGQPLLPRPKNSSGYVLHPSVTSDWAEFKTLAARGLAAGPGAGTADLEAGMALVRGRPFEGRTLPWADPVIQEMLSRITDTAHTLARWHTDGDTPDLDAARRTVLQALEVEETSEVLYRDLLHLEVAAGNHAAVRKVIARAQQMARTYNITLDDTTEATINAALTGKLPHLSQRH
ncbi:LysM peptidoglycan-binding domain-containing protein [Streptomyces sp. NPDC093801]|uniref:LysM peptidoglycan-binding domain-containing protein n=1 Tax=Streptomyces sp. NPDC093801 TaxID=3155203 RepID=UPI00344C91BD